MKSLKAILARVNQLARAVEGAASGVDIAAMLNARRREWSQRQRLYAERGHGETAAECYARHLERKPSYSVEEIPAMALPAWFLRRRLAVWTRLELEYAAEAAREAAGYPPDQDPVWWSKTDDELGEIAKRDSFDAVLVAGKLIEIDAL
jgi:hypothetical protein